LPGLKQHQLVTREIYRGVRVMPHGDTSVLAVTNAPAQAGAHRATNVSQSALEILHQLPMSLL
jgi:L-fucose mutarotase/ribose pyranase (RbsD/FucU family)